MAGSTSRKRERVQHSEAGGRRMQDDRDTEATSISRPTKRIRSHLTPPPSAACTVLSLEGSLSEEVLLRCLSFLPVEDLLRVSRVSKDWYRLSGDSQLWRSLYLSTFAPSRSRSRDLSSSLKKERTRPWRDLYKISTNWRKGNARPVTLKNQLRDSVLKDVVRPVHMSVDTDEIEEREMEVEPEIRRSTNRRDATDTILQFHGQYFFTASRTPSRDQEVPSIEVFKTSIDGSDTSTAVGVIISKGMVEYWAERKEEDVRVAITELQLDAASSLSEGLRLAVFYSTGQFSIFHIHIPSSTPSSSSTFAATEVFSSLSLVPTYPSATTFDPTLLAKFHSPLLVTCSESFTLHFYRVVIEEGDGKEGGQGRLRLEETEPSLRSRESWWPVVLTLTPTVLDVGDEHDALGRQRGDEFKVTLAYSTPVFPSSWSVGVQEFTVGIPPLSSDYSSLSTSLPPMRITQKHAIGIPTRYVFDSARNRRRTESLVTSIEHSDQWIVTSRSDNTIEVFEIVSVPTPTSIFTSTSASATPTTFFQSPPKTSFQILHRRTLFGHTSSVASVAVDEGRCVSGGVDGRVKVWELDSARSEGMTISEGEQDEREERELAFGWNWARFWKDGEEKEGREKVRIKRVWFDEEKIVSIVQDRRKERVRVLHFD